MLCYRYEQVPWELSSSENRWGEGRVLEEVLWGLWPCFHDWARVRKVKGRRQSTQAKDTACTKAPKHQRMHGWGHSERKSEGWEEVDWGRRVDVSGTTNILRVTLSSSIRGPWEAVGGFKSQEPSDLVLDRLLWLPCEEMDWTRAIPAMERPTFQGRGWGLTLAMAVGLQHQLGGRWRKRSQGWPPGFQAGGMHSRLRQPQRQQTWDKWPDSGRGVVNVTYPTYEWEGHRYVTLELPS